MLKVAVAQSLEIDSADALGEILEQCNTKLGNDKPQAGILFSGIDHDFTTVLNGITETYPGIELIGCTTDGELSSVYGYTDDSLTLVLFCSDALRFKAGVADRITEDTAATVKEAVDSAKSALGEDPRLCITTPSGLTASGDYIVEGLRLSLGENFPIFGGTAGDQWYFKQTYQFRYNRVFTDAAPFLLISGPLLYSFGVDTGWIPIGKKAKVTKSKDQVVYEIGGEKALHFYKHHLGEDVGLDDSGPASEYPLAVYAEDDDESFYLRASIILDRETGSLTFVANVPEDSTIQITHSTRDTIVEAARNSIQSSVTEYPGSKPVAALCFSCASRKRVLGTRIEEEYTAFKRDFPDLPVVGFYTYGEIGPLKKDKPAIFHNSTFFNLVIGLE